MNERTYSYYKDAFRGRLLPLAYVDLDLFDANVKTILGRSKGRTICVASKSLRCVALLKRIFTKSPQFRAIMAFSVREAVFLAGQGVCETILVAYPVWNEIEHCGLAGALNVGTRITLMVDCAEHVEHLEQYGSQHGVQIPICMDVDMSSEYPGVYFGVRRSCIRTPEQAVSLWERIRACPHVALAGLMGYEAQIAGLQDNPPWDRLRNAVIRLLKKQSIRTVAERRAAVVRALKAAGCTLRFVNGGGTGSIETTAADDVVTEVTVGSGFYSPALFDYFAGFKHEPAAGFAVEVTRKPSPGILTCHGGGYIASGSAGPDRLPQPYLPRGVRLLDQEGAGEVQTPIRYDGPEQLRIGDPILFRHAKAGELCERFNSLLLVSQGAVVDEVRTYRGEGQCFL